MNSSFINRLRFYNGREHSIDEKKLVEFEMKAIINRYYAGEEIDVATLIEDLGPINLDFTNIHPWSKTIPDIDQRSARLFTLWAEDMDTKDVVLILRGFYVVLSFKWGKNQLVDYYFTADNVPYYPIVVVSALRTIFQDEQQLTELIDRIKEELEINWRELRQQVINSLEKNSDLWRRYVFCFEKIIHYSFLCPSMDREFIEALRKKNYRTTGVMQLMSSPTISYDNVIIDNHLEEAKRLIEESERHL